MNSYEISAFPSLSPSEAIRVLRSVHAEDSDRGIALFRQCAPEGDHFVPALTILGIHPSLTFQSKNGLIRIEEKNQVRELQGNPIQLFSEILNQRKSIPSPELPFFQGGALGYFGYDAVRFIEPTLQQTKNLGVTTEKYDAELIFFKSYLVLDHQKNSAVLISESAEDEKQVRALLKSHVRHVKQTADSTELPTTRLAELPLSSFRTAFGKEAFMTGVNRLKAHIKDGDIFQAVLAEKFEHDFGGDAIDLFESLLQVNPAPYQFFFSLAGRSYLGASPEMLLKVDGKAVETHPIAGTRARGKTPEEERKNELQLLNCAKEKAEHLMLVDLARNDIGRVSAPGTVNVVSFQKLRKFGGVMHLVSKVTGELTPKMDAMGALASCFPAGTLSGAPKIRAMGLLSQLEPEPRGFYGGAFIAASVTGDLDSCISIRSMSVEKGVVTVQAGAGIVADSSPENEYLEIEHKTRLARLALAMALEKSKLGAAI